jgi:BirA family biotin operon repressor/biotin-[acetyl-CoA-carboxylase] ligase
MSTTAPMGERTVTAVLLSLWRRPESTIQQLLRDTLAPLPDVQQALDLLRERRCLIEQTPDGIRLVSTGLACWRDILEHVAANERLRVGRRVMVFFRTASTNDIAWQCAPSPENDGLVVVADEQSAGRGRLGHTWLAKPEQSILCSILLRDMPAASVDRVTLLAGLAAARGIERALADAHAPRSIDIKWPNDLLLAGRKVAGILVERRGENIVIGLGINVAQTAADFPRELADRATSIYQGAGVVIDRLPIVAAVLREMNAVLADPAGGARGEDWITEWKQRCTMLGTRVEVRSGDRLFRGLVLDVDPLRGLLLRDDQGATHFLSAQTTTFAV